MGESAADEKDPYMQAYITARMKNQVEEMKLQKLLSTMEVSQRVKKIMINLELFEDRKMAHKLQQEVVKVEKRERKETIRHLRRNAERHQRTANWTTSLAATEHAHAAPGLPQSVPRLPQTSAGDRGVYPVTGKVKDHGGSAGAGLRDSLPELAPHSRGQSAQQVKRKPVHKTSFEHVNIMPLIQVTDCDGDGVTTVVAPGLVPTKPDADVRDLAASAKAVPRLASEQTWARSRARVTTSPPVKTAVIVTPPPLSHRVPHPPPPRRPATEPHCHRSAEGSLSFPPVPVRARSTRTRCAHSTNTARALDGASGMWPGDPRAICSVRRSRRNVEEMLATKKAGEETRRLIRESRVPCSRNCWKPDIMSMMEKTYVNLPDLLPEIEKARKQLVGDPEEQQVDRPPLPDRRPSHARFDLEQGQEAGTNLYKIRLQQAAPDGRNQAQLRTGVTRNCLKSHEHWFISREIIVP